MRSVKQFAPAFILRIALVLDLQPSHARAVAIPQALGDNAFEIVCAHQLEKLVAPARDRQRLGNDR